MTKHLLTSALFAGVVTGLIAALLQFHFVIPLLLEGELYEAGARIHFPINGSPQSPAEAPDLGADWELGIAGGTEISDVSTTTTAADWVAGLSGQ